MLDILLAAQDRTARAALYGKRVLDRIFALREARKTPLLSLYTATGLHFRRIVREKRGISLRGAVEAANLFEVPVDMLLAEVTPDLGQEIADMLVATTQPGVERIGGHTATYRASAALNARRITLRMSVRRASTLSGIAKSWWGNVRTLRRLPLERLHAAADTVGLDWRRAIYDRSLGKAPLQEGV